MSIDKRQAKRYIADIEHIEATNQRLQMNFSNPWNIRLADWADEGKFACLVAASMGMFAAAQYLHSLGAPLAVARFYLLGV